jgi:outer membrane lipoprotein-sorting protein
LVASDQLTPKGELQRQRVEAFAKSDGVSFPSKETIFVAGIKSGEVTYDQVRINPDVPAGLFDFPSF